LKIYNINIVYMETELTKNEKLKAKNKLYYANNKEKVGNAAKVKVICRLCKKEVCKGALNYHMKSKLCLKEQQILLQIKKLDLDI